jgi:hypothetical protein
MESFMWGLKIGLWTLTVLLVVFGLLATVYFLAKKNIFFTFVEEGTAKVIMKFNAFYGVIMQYQNCTCRKEDDWEVEVPRERPRKRLWGGLYCVGIPGIYSLFSYKFRWATIKTQKKPDEQVDRREETLLHIFVKDYLYLAEIYGAETKGLVSLDISFIVTARVVNPYKALFRVHDWANVIVARIEAYFRQYVATVEYQDIIAKKQEIGGQIMKALGETGMLEDLAKKPTEQELSRFSQRNIPREERETLEEKIKRWKGIFWHDYGVKVKNIEMREITPSGENKKAIQEAATRQWVAERDKEGILTRADAEVQRLAKVYGKIREFGDTGITLRTLEALESAGNKTGNWIVFPFNLLERLFGKGGKE